MIWFLSIICPIVGILSFYYLSYSSAVLTTNNDLTDTLYSRIILCCVIAYLPTYIFTHYFSKRGGYTLKWFQHSKYWLIIKKYFNADIAVEEILDNSKSYIFCSFPHGACTGKIDALLITYFYYLLRIFYVYIYYFSMTLFARIHSWAFFNND